MSGRPAEYLNWDTDNQNILTPPSNLLASGWKPGMAPPAEYENYALQLLDQWIQYLDGVSAANWISVTQFGAIGNGSFNCTTQIQAALDSLEATGGTLFFPTGTYIISAPLTLYSNIAIEGEGSNASVIATAIGNVVSATENSGYLQGTDIQNIRFSNIKILGHGTWSGTSFTNPYGGGNSVGFTNDDVGVKIQASSTGIKNITFQNCEFSGIGKGIYLAGLNTEENARIESCYFTNIGMTASYLVNIDFARVTGNIVQGIPGNLTAGGDTSTSDSKFGDGHLFRSCTNWVASDNEVTNFIRCGIIIEPADGFSANGNTHTSTSVTGLPTATVTTLQGLLASGFTVGVVGSGVAAKTVVSTIASGTSITLSLATSTSLTSTGLTFITYTQNVSINANVISNQNNGRGSQDWSAIYSGDGYITGANLASDNVISNIFGNGTDSTGTGGAGIYCDHLDVSGGEIFNCTQYGIRYIDGPVNIQGVRVYNNGWYGLQWPSATGNLRVANSQFIKNGYAGISASQLTANAFAEISSNIFHDNGLLTTPLGSGNEGIGLAAITIGGVVSTEQFVVKNNTFISSAAPTDTTGQLYGIAVQVSNDFNRYIRDNEFIFTSASLAAYSANYNTEPACFATFFTSGGYTSYDLLHQGNRNNKIAWSNNPNWIGSCVAGYPRNLGFATAAPGSGTFLTGDFFLNSALGPGQPEKFLCIAGGTPGTWLPYSGAAKEATTQTFLTGSGTYTTPVGCTCIIVEMVGGGGGGGASETNSGTGGGNTTFGTTFLIADGGSGGLTGSLGGGGGAGGSASKSTADGIAVAGAGGASSSVNNVGSPFFAFSGGNGGNSALGGAGNATGQFQSGTNAATNSGSGGGGSSGTATTLQGGGGGGGAGGYVRVRIPAPASTYSYLVGTKGAKGTGTYNGGDGSLGQIVVTELY